MHSTFLDAEMRRRDVEKALPSSLGGGAFLQLSTALQIFIGIHSIIKSNG